MCLSMLGTQTVHLWSVCVCVCVCGSGGKACGLVTWRVVVVDSGRCVSECVREWVNVRRFEWPLVRNGDMNAVNESESEKVHCQIHFHA